VQQELSRVDGRPRARLASACLGFVVRWLTAFIFTQIVEMGIYAQATGRERPLRERLAIAFCCSGITHPLVWYVIPDVTSSIGVTWWPTVAIAETFAVVAEAALLACFGVRAPLLWALLANGTSFLIGLFCYTHFGW
jgi:hypothetical protein